jgi:hypothetical protein
MQDRIVRYSDEYKVLRYSGQHCKRSTHDQLFAELGNPNSDVSIVLESAASQVEGGIPIVEKAVRSSFRLPAFSRATCGFVLSRNLRKARVCRPVWYGSGSFVGEFFCGSFLHSRVAGG